VIATNDPTKLAGRLYAAAELTFQGRPVASRRAS